MYQLLKSIHVFAVVIFMGNIITGLFWKMHADGTKNRAIIAHMMRGLIRADRWFTIPGVVVITAAGILAAIQGGLPLLRTGWILWSLILFAVSGLVFVLRVAPLQIQLRALAQAGVDKGSFDWAGYHRLAKTWERWGALALLTPIAALVLMVLKPTL